MSDGGTDQTGWWIGAGGVATAILTAIGSWFAASRKQDAENSAREDARADRAYGEVIDRQEERIATLEQRADDCEQDRARLTARVAHLESVANN